MSRSLEQGQGHSSINGILEITKHTHLYVVHLQLKECLNNVDKTKTVS